MTAMRDSNQAQSFCVDGDIKMVAGDNVAAAIAYLQAHTLHASATKEHVESLSEEQRKELIDILQEWIKRQKAYDKSTLGITVTADQVWEFIFCLDPEAVVTCFASIESFLQHKCYQEVIDSCTAIIKHYPLETVSILLKRALARTLMGDQDKEAIADYLRAFLKDKETTIRVVQVTQSEHLESVKKLMLNCVHSQSPPVNEVKPYKQWLALTIDCCRFLLAFEPENFQLQMTFVEKLKAIHKTDKAISMLTEMLDAARHDPKTDQEQLTKILLKRSACHTDKQHVDIALNDISAGLNAAADLERALFANNDDFNCDKEFKWLMASRKKSSEIAKEIYGGKSNDLADLYVTIDKAASKLHAEDRFKAVTKMENIRLSIDFYRAMLVLQPSSKDALFKLGSSYARLGKNKLAVKIFDKLLEDPHFAQDAAILTARALCYRELGKKVEAQKDYDTLLRHKPRDVTLLCERALVCIEDDDITACVEDLLAASRINQKAVVSHVSKEPLVQRTRLRQVLFDYAKTLLQDAPLPTSKTPHADVSHRDVVNDDTLSVTLGISQVLTKLNPSDLSCHILLAHAMFHAGSVNDAETKLKKMLHENTQTLDTHVIKLHLGLIKVFTKRRDEGMSVLIDVLTKKSARVFSSLLRDIPISERARLADESHQYGIDILQSNREMETVKEAVHCFTLAILCCRGTDLVLEESSFNPWLLLTDATCLAGIRKKSDKMAYSSWSLASLSSFSVLLKTNFRFNPATLFDLRKMKRRRLNGGTGVYRSYLARAECMAHIGDQRAAILDFSAAVEINSSCVEGLCGRAFMRLALGDETECVNDVTLSCDVDLQAVVAHIHALPDDAKKMLLFWIDHRVVVLLLNYGYKSGDRLGTGGSASTISMLDETTFKPGEDVSRSSSLSSIHPPSYPADPSSSQVTEKQRSADDEAVSKPSDESNENENPAKVKQVADTKEDESMKPEDDAMAKQQRKLHKSNTKDLKDALLNLDVDYEQNLVAVQHQKSRESFSTTVTSFSTYDDVTSNMEKAEILHKCLTLGKLLTTVDPNSPTWQGMYADILIVKGDYEEALRHLQLVMELSPNDVTAPARAGLINVKINRYKTACRLLGSLANVDHSGLVYVLKALDISRRRRLAEEAFSNGEKLGDLDKHAEARDLYTLSLLADSYSRAEKLRFRSRCHRKMGEIEKAIIDISEVIKENVRKPQAADYCARASLYLVEGKEFQTCRDYIKALQLDRTQSITLMHIKPGRNLLSTVFYRQALIAYSRHNYQECSDLCDFALLIDNGNIDMRKLRARAKRELSKCVIQ
ncbi:unnamed protein product [Clavelina lepadiformis]|uniref:Tetratricopeptide repeat protein n=1 Tax=Clavelina lepadiformis TaxID=159417 RepID=A0ABP0H5S2_CLALP